MAPSRFAVGILTAFLLAVFVPFASAADRGPELLEAASKGDTTHVKKLLEIGVNVDSRDKNERTPLMLAAQHGHTETVRLLLSKGAHAEARDQTGWTAYGLTLDPNGGVFHRQHEEVLKLLPPPAPVRTAVDAGWSPEDLISSCFMTRDQLINLVEGMHLDALMLTAFQGYASASGNGIVKVVRADRHGLGAPAHPENPSDFDAFLSLEVRPRAACGQGGDTLSLAIDARVFQVHHQVPDPDMVLKRTFGGGLKGLPVRTVANGAQYLPLYDGWVNAHAGQVFRTALAAALKVAP